MVDQVFDIEPRIQYVASAGQTVFPYPFPIFFETDVKVNQDGTLLTLTTEYTVDGVGDSNGGNITLVTPANAGDILTIYRQSVKQRLVDYAQNGSFLADDVNDDFDRLWLCIQESSSTLQRAITVAIDDTATDLELPQARENQLITFDGIGNVLLTELPENTASNLGLGEGVFAQKVVNDLQFKSLVAGANIGLSSTGSEITIDATVAGESNTASNLGAGDGVFAQKNGVDLEFKSLVGGANVNLVVDANTIQIDSVGDSIDTPLEIIGTAFDDTNETLIDFYSAAKNELIGQVGEFNGEDSFTVRAHRGDVVLSSADPTGDFIFQDSTDQIRLLSTSSGLSVQANSGATELTLVGLSTTDNNRVYIEFRGLNEIDGYCGFTNDSERRLYLASTRSGASTVALSHTFSDTGIKLETLADPGGVEIFGDSIVNGDLTVTGDLFGAATGGVFTITGTADDNTNLSYVDFAQNNGSSDGFVGKFVSGNDDIYLGSVSGAVKLLHAGTGESDIRAQTESTGIRVDGGASETQIGLYGNDLGVNNRVFAGFYDSAASLRGFIGYINPTDENISIVNSVGSVNLADSGFTRLQTESTGIRVFGTSINVNGTSSSASNILLNDNGGNLIAALGMGSPERLFLQNLGTGDTRVQSGTAGTVRLQHQGNLDTDLRLQTEDTGVRIDGDGTSTLLRLIGAGTAPNNSARLDLMQSDGVTRQATFACAVGTNNLLIAADLGAIELRHNGPSGINTKLETESTGVRVFGAVELQPAETGSANGFLQRIHNNGSTASGNDFYLGLMNNARHVDGAAYNFWQVGSAGVDGQGIMISRVSPFQVLNVFTNTTDEQALASVIFNVDSTGNVTASGSISDRRVKENIKPIDDSLSIINQIPVVNYDRKDTKQNCDGIIMQDIIDLIPSAVVKGVPMDDFDGADLHPKYLPLIAHLIRAVQQLEEKINELSH